MRTEGERRSENVDDLRGRRIGLPRGGVRRGGIGLGGLLLLLGAAWLLGLDPLTVLGGLSETGAGAPGIDAGYEVDVDPGGSAPGAAQDPLADFVAVVLGSTEDTWAEIFQSAGAAYDPPRLVLFTDAVRSACGLGQSAMGPFYCPSDRKVYIDLGFYRDLRQRFGAPGDFAQAYVIAHEVGHHVQNLLGIAEQVQGLREQSSREESNALSVRMELQADCYAGVWAHHANRRRQILEPGDVEEGLRAASAIGDDRIQRQTQGTVVPEAFTHGSSEQRVQWFRRGIEGGSMQACDTFRSRSS